MATIKSAMPDYFGTVSFQSAYEGAYEKGAAVESFARRLAGNALERAYSGNDAGVKFLRTKAESLTLAKKGVLASKFRAIEAHIVAIKSQSLKSADIGDYEAYADSQFCEILAALVPPKVDSIPKAKAPSYRALYEAKCAEYDALKIDNDALSEALAELRKIGTVAKATASV